MGKDKDGGSAKKDKKEKKDKKRKSEAAEQAPEAAAAAAAEEAPAKKVLVSAIAKPLADDKLAKKASSHASACCTRRGVA